MNIVKWDPFKDIQGFFDDSFFPSSANSQLGFDLAVDVYEKGDNIVAEVNAPGLEEDDIHVDIEDGILRISASREEAKEEKDKKFYSKQIVRGSFERTIRIPSNIEADKAEAEYHKGVLKISIPKRQKTSGSIKVRVPESQKSTAR